MDKLHIGLCKICDIYFFYSLPTDECLQRSIDSSGMVKMVCRECDKYEKRENKLKRIIEDE
jgi:hypothetical protein